MLYFSLKILHVLSAAVLLTSMVYCLQYWRNLQQFPDSMISLGAIQKITGLVVLPLAIFQLTTGFTMICVKQYDISQIWVKGSLIGFISVMISWFAFIYFLLSSREMPSRLRFYKMIQISMLFICIFSLFSMIFLMANKI